MQLLRIEDTTSPSYWLNWRALLCSLWVLTPMLVAIYIIWKYERPTKHSESDTNRIRDQRSRILSDDDTCWRPCLEEIPACLLLLYRIIAFCLLSVALSFDVAAHGSALFHYYTQWAFTLVTIYFGLGSLLSLYGCCQHNRIAYKASNFDGEDTEKGLYRPLVSGVATNGKAVEWLGSERKVSNPRCAGLLSCLFQILFQMTAGAVMLTDSVYWFVIFPFINIKNYEMSFLTVVAHSLNAILLFGDAALNSLNFPWFRICYFILWTGSYVIVEWTIHAFVPMWWPYPFLDLSRPYAPLWYLIVALLHIPCFGVFALIVKFRAYVLARWFPQPNWCLR